MLASERLWGKCVNDEPTRIPRSGSQYRGKHSATPTDKTFDEVLGKGEKITEIIKKIAAFGSTGGAGGLLGQALSEVANVPDVKWWMTCGMALAFHLAVFVADFATKALRKINTVGSKVEIALARIEGIANQMSDGRAVHEELRGGHKALSARMTSLEGEWAAWREEAERKELIRYAHDYGIVLQPDMTIEEMRAAVKRSTSKGKLPSFRHKPQTDETAVQPPTIDFDSLDPEA